MKQYSHIVYDHLPNHLRSLAATLYGYRLRHFRYGGAVENRVQRALERDHWSADKWEQWQQSELRNLLDLAATQVPYYRRRWSKHSRRDWLILANWPIVEKEEIRENAEDFLVGGGNSKLYPEHTSGTTGTPLTVWESQDTQRQWYALFEARWRRWYGVSRHDRWAILGGRVIKPASETRPPYWIWNGAFRQLYMSSYHLAPDAIPHYLDAIAKYRIRYIYGYTSALHELALEANRRKRNDLRMQVAIANAEPVFAHQRNEIQQAFHCTLRETYGMSEKCCAASECEAGGLHLWPDVGIVEIINGLSPVEAGQTGDLVCTGLLNRDMPLIRYRVGDQAAMAVNGNCRCGRTLPLLDRIEGRCDDYFLTARGERIGRLDSVFKRNLQVKMAQLIQESLEHVRVRYIPAPGFSQDDTKEITRQLRLRFGNIKVTFEEVASIPRTANGKFPAVVCRLLEEDSERAAAAQTNR